MLPRLTTPRSMFMVPVFVAAALLCACDDEGGHEHGDDDSGCMSDSRAETYEAGMAKSGQTLTIEIVSATPSPPGKGDNQWTIRLSDAAGEPIDGAEVMVTTWMPDHGHGGTVDPVVTAGGGPGGYLLDPIHFHMAGLWEITVHADPGDGSEADAVTFGFCVES